MPKRREIENRKAAIAQPDLKVRRSASLNYNRSLIVRPAMRKRIGGTLQRGLGNGAVARHNAEDSAHYVPPITKYTNVTSSRRARERVISILNPELNLDVSE